MIGTLRKAWGDEAPCSLGYLLLIIFMRGYRTQPHSSAAAESAALGAAHLLPALLRCGPTFIILPFCRAVLMYLAFNALSGRHASPEPVCADSVQ